MSDDLDLLITKMARLLAHHHQCSLAEATRQIRSLVVQACEEYRTTTSPCGDDHHGFCRLLLARPRVASTASHIARPTSTNRFLKQSVQFERAERSPKRELEQ